MINLLRKTRTSQSTCCMTWRRKLSIERLLKLNFNQTPTQQLMSSTNQARFIESVIANLRTNKSFMSSFQMMSKTNRNLSWAIKFLSLFLSPSACSKVQKTVVIFSSNHKIINAVSTTSNLMTNKLAYLIDFNYQVGKTSEQLASSRSKTQICCILFTVIRTSKFTVSKI